MDYEFDKSTEAAKAEIQNTVRKIGQSAIFNDAYLSQIRLAFLTSDLDRVLVHHGETVSADDTKKYTDERGFELGIKRNSIPLEDRQSYEAQSMHDSQRIQELFYSVGIPYDEFVAHELGHNVFDRAYVKSYGEFEIYGEQDPDTAETKGVITDVSKDYRAKIIGKLKTLLTEAGLNLDVDSFFGDERNNRQKIAEIFALMVQREFAVRTNSSYLAEHQAVDSRVRTFLENPEKAIADYIQKTGRQISLEDFYRENHTLSFVVVPLLENQYKNFDKRAKFLEVDTQGLLN